MRLTLLYGTLFLLAGAVLLGTTYGLLAGGVIGSAQATISSGKVNSRSQPVGPALAILGAAAAGKQPAGVQGKSIGPTEKLVIRPSEHVSVSAHGALSQLARQEIELATGRLASGQARRVYSQLAAAGSSFLGVQLATQHESDLSSLLTISILVLAAMAIVSIGLGWIVAGRALAPLRTMTARAQQISEHNLHERLALDGPDDELHELADTFDGLLTRLERAFEAQRRFVANASHELRTPLTVERAMLEVALADPGADAASLRAVCQRVIELGEEQERLIEALLTLARSERGVEARAPVNLTAVVRSAIAGIRGRGGLEVRQSLEQANVGGDRRLLERLVANLLDNAVRHNEAGGWVRVELSGGERPLLHVSNSGPVVAPAEVDRLLEPFRRAATERAGRGDGHGLGLSIVAAIAQAHGAELSVRARDGGGLEVEVRFSAP